MSRARRQAAQKRSHVRRRRYYWLVVLMGIAALGLYALYQPQPVDDEKKLTRIIAAIEEGFDDLNERLKATIDQIQNEELRQQMQLPFILVNMNQANPNKNYVTFMKKTPELNGQMMQLENPNFFFYRLIQEKERTSNAFHPMQQWMVAGFNPLERVLYLNEDPTSLNELDLVVVYHEVVHVGQDSRVRDHISSKEAFDEYSRFYTTNQYEAPRIVINYEVGAFALELEFLDILLGGYLRNAGLHGPIDASEVSRRLNARPDQRELVVFLSELAGYYFPEGVIGLTPPQPFFNYIANIYQRAGNELFITTTTGKLAPYHPKRS